MVLLKFSDLSCSAIPFSEEVQMVVRKRSGFLLTQGLCNHVWTEPGEYANRTEIILVFLHGAGAGRFNDNLRKLFINLPDKADICLSPGVGKWQEYHEKYTSNAGGNSTSRQIF